MDLTCNLDLSILICCNLDSHVFYIYLHFNTWTLFKSHAHNPGFAKKSNLTKILEPIQTLKAKLQC